MSCNFRREMMKQFFVLLIGTFFGIVLVKSEVVSWFRIQKMFLFEEAHMYLIIASAVAVGAVAVYIIKRFQLKTVFNEDVAIKAKPYQKGVVIGGVLFGIGWAITGACPGPIYAQIGSGEYIALITFGAALIGMYLYAFLQPKLPH
ncbi:MAG: YeeE/YedE family protein [Anaerolineae bacterium]|nr:YeeE/YedE family protein [Anaerolineae bacterium]MCB0182188.1 YeeE/YedE family protein [Anaerolineae bacterium]MCB9107999.1 YeeE/YedE family protein [Anaerolineales bacterium]